MLTNRGFHFLESSLNLSKWKKKKPKDVCAGIFTENLARALREKRRGPEMGLIPSCYGLAREELLIDII